MVVHARYRDVLSIRAPGLQRVMGRREAWSAGLDRSGRSLGGGRIAGEVALDFLFWPTQDRKFGWFFEPTYGYSFSNGHEQSLGMSTGLVIPVP